MKFTSRDKIQSDNLLRAMNKAKFDDLNLEEVVAFAQCLQWFVELRRNVDIESKIQEPAPTPAPMPVVVEEPVKKKSSKKSKGKTSGSES